MPTASRLEPGNRRVLVATDFSAAGNAAVDRAYAHVCGGGTVYLAHVLAPARRRSPLEPQDIFTGLTESSATQQNLEEKLRGLVPAWATVENKATEITLLESRDPAQAIVQAAERLGVDAICVGTGARSELASAVLGSVALGVLMKTRRPVLVVHAPAP
jgi:nucleotide-binding universal stress UspA family protein